MGSVPWRCWQGQEEALPCFTLPLAMLGRTQPVTVSACALTQLLSVSVSVMESDPCFVMMAACWVQVRLSPHLKQGQRVRVLRLWIDVYLLVGIPLKPLLPLCRVGVRLF